MQNFEQGSISLEAQVAVNSSRLNQLEDTAKRLIDKDELNMVIEKQKDFVTKAEFWPVKTLVFGAAGPLLLAALAAFAKLIFKP